MESQSIKISGGEITFICSKDIKDFNKNESLEEGSFLLHGDIIISGNIKIHNEAGDQ